MSKHTKGPFEVSERFMTNEGQRAVMAPDAELGRKRVALVDAQKRYKRGEGWKLDDDPERDANAKLFASSDELAQLLLESRENIGGDWRERRDAALRKAGVLK